MLLISVMYPAGEGATFDHDYYLRKHIPLVRERWSGMGLQEARVFRGTGAADGGSAPYQVLALLTFSSLQDFQNAAQKHGPEIFADIPNFTNVQPVVQLNEPMS